MVSKKAFLGLGHVISCASSIAPWSKLVDIACGGELSGGRRTSGRLGFSGVAAGLSTFVVLSSSTALITERRATRLTDRELSVRLAKEE